MSASYIPPPSLPLSGSPPNMTGPIAAYAGSASLPSLYFGSDTTTGFFDSGTNKIGFAGAGAQVAEFSTTGFVVSIPGGGTANLNVAAEGNVGVTIARYFASSTAPNLTLEHARGTIASPSAIATNDIAGQVAFSGYGTSAFKACAQVQAVVIEPTPSDTAMGGSLRFRATTLGGVVVTEIARFEAATGISMFGAFPVIDANRVFRKRVFTFATLPTGADGMAAFISDSSVTTFATDAAGGGANHVPVYYSSGTSTWKVG